MSHITDLLSKVTQTRPRKDIPPGLTNSINTYKKRETNRKRAFLLSAIVVASLIAGFATIYAARYLLSAGAGEVRPRAAEKVAMAAAEINSPRAPSADNAPPAPTAQSKPTPVKKAEKTGTGGSTGRSAQRASAAPSPPSTPKSAAPSAEPDTSNALRHYYMALDFEKEGNLMKAVGEYTKALAAEPHNFRLMNKVGSLYMQMKLWEEAGGYLKASVAENGRYVPSLINIGIVYAEKGSFEEAERSFKEALSLEPANAIALFNIALLYEKNGMEEKARENYMKLKRLGQKQGEAGIERLDRNSTAQ